MIFVSFKTDADRGVSLSGPWTDDTVACLEVEDTSTGEVIGVGLTFSEASYLHDGLSRSLHKTPVRTLEADTLRDNALNWIKENVDLRESSLTALRFSQFLSAVFGLKAKVVSRVELVPNDEP